MIDIIIAILIGTFAGIITGLTPGIHINTVSVLLISLSALLLEITSPLILCVFIISMGIFHTFMNIIPSIFLGAPEEATALAVLPGHRLLLEGKGYEAVFLTIIGSLFGLLLTIIITPLLLIFVPNFYEYIKDYVVYFLIISSIVLILKDKNKFWVFVIFIISGILGIYVLNVNIKNPLFPLLSGLFGIPGLLMSLKDKVNIPKQKITITDVKKSEIFKSLSSGLVASTMLGFFPGIGNAQAAILASSFSKKWTNKTYLILVGSIDTIVFFLSIVAFYTINRARNGAIVALSKLVEKITINDLVLFIGISLIVGGLATILTLAVAKYATKLIQKMNYQKTCLTIILFIFILAFVFCGFLGVYILILSTAVGLLPILKGVGRNHLMGCLIIPVILFFLL